MIKIGLVDDEENARRVLLKYLERYCEVDYQIVFETTQLQESIDATLLHQPDLLFLDINLLDGLGVDVAQQIKGKVATKVIFTTAYNEYAINALRLKAFDYLLKPIDIDEFKDALYRVIEEISTEKVSNIPSASTKLSVTTLSGTQIIEKSDISYIKAEGSYCDIIFNNGKSITISKPLKYIEQKVELNSNFLKIHKSYIINTDFVLYLDRNTNEVILNNKVNLPISRSNIKTVFGYFQPKGN